MPRIGGERGTCLGGQRGCEAQVVGAVNAMELTPFLLAQRTEQRMTGKWPGG